MADVTPNDVILVPWQAQVPPTVRMTQAGDPNLPAAAAFSGALEITFPDIFALATVTVQGTPGDDLAFWRFGFIQLGFINNDWAHYRNPDPAEGSVFVARDRAPALDQPLCRTPVAKTGFLVGSRGFLSWVRSFLRSGNADEGLVEPPGQPAFYPWDKNPSWREARPSLFFSAIRHVPIGGGSTGSTTRQRK